MKQTNCVGYLKTPIGFLKIVTSKSKLLSVQFAKKGSSQGNNAILRKSITQLHQYFQGKRKSFSLPVDFEGTDFQIRVWRELGKIRYGTKCSYLDIAHKLGDNKCSRAVGNANHCNSIAIVIPCHRVVRKNGEAGGYASGSWRKEWLLEHERIYC